jgi:hypothetical protein
MDDSFLVEDVIREIMLRARFMNALNISLTCVALYRLWPLLVHDLPRHIEVIMPFEYMTRFINIQRFHTIASNALVSSSCSTNPIFGNITTLQVSGDFSDVSNLTKLVNITDLKINVEELIPELWLLQFPKLRSLRCYNIETPERFRPFTLTQLQKLHLYDAGDYYALELMTNLTSLSVDDNFSMLLRHISNLTNLTSLKTNCSDFELKHVPNLPKLHALYAPWCDGQSLSRQICTNLKSITVRFTDVETLLHVTNLTKLVCEDAPSDENVDAICKLTKLKSLTLYNSEYLDNRIKNLTNLEKLQLLARSEITLDTLVALPRLTDLDIGNMELSTAITRFTQLRCLSIRRSKTFENIGGSVCRTIGPEHLELLVGLTNLIKLSLPYLNSESSLERLLRKC